MGIQLLVNQHMPAISKGRQLHIFLMWSIGCGDVLTWKNIGAGIMSWHERMCSPLGLSNLSNVKPWRETVLVSFCTTDCFHVVFSQETLYHYQQLCNNSCIISVAKRLRSFLCGRLAASNWTGWCRTHRLIYSIENCRITTVNWCAQGVNSCFCPAPVSCESINAKVMAKCNVALSSSGQELNFVITCTSV